MVNNSIKANWTLHQLRWELHDPGDINQWDGLTKLFISIVNANDELKKDNYVMNWYKTSLKMNL